MRAKRHPADNQRVKRPPADHRPAIALHVIHEAAVYDIAQAQLALGLRRSTIGREVREGRLRISRRAGKYLILGAWLLEWIRGGEKTRQSPRLAKGHSDEVA